MYYRYIIIIVLAGDETDTTRGIMYGKWYNNNYDFQSRSWKEKGNRYYYYSDGEQPEVCYERGKCKRHLIIIRTKKKKKYNGKKAVERE